MLLGYSAGTSGDASQHAATAGSSLIVDHTSEGPVPIAQVCREMRTGDLVFFSGNSWTSLVTRLFTWSKWSHVAMCEYNPAISHYKYMWESLLNPEPGVIDVWTQTPIKRGVRLSEVLQRIDGYGRHDRMQFIDIGVMHFHVEAQVPPDQLAAIHQDIHRRFSEFQNRVHPKAFEHSPLNLARAEFKDVIGEAPHGPAQDYFCSQLMVDTYQAMGVMDRSVNPKSVTPAMLAQYPGRLPFLQGFRLGPELHVYRVSLDPPLA